MTVLHSGSTKKFAEGWDSIFSGKKKSAGMAKKTGSATVSKGTSSKKKSAPSKSIKKKR